jgi:hypothetical protein
MMRKIGTFGFPNPMKKRSEISPMEHPVKAGYSNFGLKRTRAS